MKRFIALVLAAAGLLTAGSALAWGYYGGPRVSLGFHYGYWGPGPYFWGPPVYAPYYYPPAVIVTSPPPPVQYVERPYQVPAPVQQQSQNAGLTPGYWYYCDNPRGYYPHVKECPAPWKAVPPVPPPNTPPE